MGLLERNLLGKEVDMGGGGVSDKREIELGGC